MWLKEIIVESWNSLARHRLRSVLTMLGITWGLVTVVLLLGYGQGVGESVFNAFVGIGNNVIISWGGQTSMQAGGERSGRRIRFKYEDLQAIRDEVPILKGVSAEDNNGCGSAGRSAGHVVGLQHLQPNSTLVSGATGHGSLRAAWWVIP